MFLQKYLIKIVLMARGQVAKLLNCVTDCVLGKNTNGVLLNICLHTICKIDIVLNKPPVLDKINVAQECTLGYHGYWHKRQTSLSPPDVATLYKNLQTQAVFYMTIQSHNS